MNREGIKIGIAAIENRLKRNNICRYKKVYGVGEEEFYSILNKKITIKIVRQKLK
ncbi:hypothetical protein [Brachyspira hampsonii]|uniref:hypothetical protein n=1 Tax=Brachyspira hampsonii TaxID=1287055 RepID=UPI0015E6FC45|nr:hypothetical protein [Brachyspira hampsonii]